MYTWSSANKTLRLYSRHHTSLKCTSDYVCAPFEGWLGSQALIECNIISTRSRVIPIIKTYKPRFTIYPNLPNQGFTVIDTYAAHGALNWLWNLCELMWGALGMIRQFSSPMCAEHKPNVHCAILAQNTCFYCTKVFRTMLKIFQLFVLPWDGTLTVSTVQGLLSHGHSHTTVLIAVVMWIGYIQPQLKICNDGCIFKFS